MTALRTLILGGGMSGLSCAYHLGGDSYRLVERSDEPGGLSRSVKHEGFVFDHTGHLLHLRNPYTLKLIPQLLGDNLAEHARRAWIYSHHTYTRYPYQANLYGLPKRVIQECLKGLIDAQLEGGIADSTPESLASWVLRTFGKGFARHFFFPYNEKLWTVPADVLTAEWVAPFVPKPPIQETIEGALTEQKKRYGYNATFFYPKTGGIQSLAFAFAKDLTGVQLNMAVTAVNLSRREATLSSGEIVRFDHLVTTLPLVKFLELTTPLPAEIQEAAGLLRWSSVYNINLGIKRSRLSEAHWIYFPERKYKFYRVGFPMNFAASMTPRGCSSMYIEMAHQPGRPPDEKQAMKDALRGLRESDLLKPEDKIVALKVLTIPVAYVTYDRHRTKASQQILKFLEDRKIYSIGRFGGWKYSYMEEAILEGQATAEKILGQ